MYCTSRMFPSVSMISVILLFGTGSLERKRKSTGFSFKISESLFNNPMNHLSLMSLLLGSGLYTAMRSWSLPPSVKWHMLTLSCGHCGGSSMEEEAPSIPTVLVKICSAIAALAIAWPWLQKEWKCENCVCFDYQKRTGRNGMLFTSLCICYFLTFTNFKLSISWIHQNGHQRSFCYTFV